MKRFIVILILFHIINFVQGQIYTPVKWTFATKQIGNGEVMVFMKANIDQDWHIYSQKCESNGPVRTSFTFNKSGEYQIIGQVAEPKPKVKFDKTFNSNVKYFENEVVFQQKIKLNKAKGKVSGKIEYMVCNDSQCLPPEEKEFTILID